LPSTNERGRLAVNRLLVLTLGFHGLAGLLAPAVARRRPEYRPVAFFLAGTAIADVIYGQLVFLVLEPATTAMRDLGLDPDITPLDGWARVVANIATAIFLSWYAGLAALALAVFARRRPWHVAVLWAVTSIALAVGYPATRGEFRRHVYLAADLIALAV